jgi:ATP-dependent RNA helicase DDX20
MLCDKLNANNWPTTYISAEKCQTERLKALSKLKKYKCRVLVSTDLTARGIDVENVNLVINMDVPYDGETYLHRIGRAGRFGTYFLIAFH